MKKHIVTLLLTTLASACSYTPAPVGVQEKFYDFDEKVHYYQTNLGNGNYELEVVEDGYRHFTRQSVFLLRHARSLCGGQPYTLRVKEGVQKYDRFPVYPRKYEPNLLAEVRCDNGKDKEKKKDKSKS